MASTPGILSDWPWKPLGSYKYVILAPWIIRNTYAFLTKDPSERDLSSFLILPLLLSRFLHNQLWVSFSRYRTAKGTTRIVDRGIEFDQVDRESNWDDQILFNGVLLYGVTTAFSCARCLPMWRTDGVVITALLHAGPVEFLYYWLHRALHHHYLYSRYHSHHHSSIVTEPITSVIHPFAEHIAYYLLFAIPMISNMYTGRGSVASVAGYITFVDLMNNMGHCNFELIPRWIFSTFPPLKYIMYTPTYHSLHHTQFRTNYSLFMPIYDYIYGTMDKSTDTLYENSLKRGEEWPDVVHLTHFTTPNSIYHLRLGFANLASRPHTPSKWYLWFMWPLTVWTMMLTWLYGYTFVVERNRFDKLRLQTWAIPKYILQYLIPSQKESIKRLVEEAILEADKRGVKVLTLGLYNQGDELNKYGEEYVQKHLGLKTKVVDGNSLAVAVVLNSIPNGTTQVVLRGIYNKVSYGVVYALCQRGIQVLISSKADYEKVKTACGSNYHNNLVLSKSYSRKVWLIGDGLSEEDQKKAPKGTIFIPFSQFPPKKVRKDCFYHTTPAMLAPPSLENVDSCENWLPRRVMSAWRVAGIVHAIEGWEHHECGYNLSHIEKVWQATLQYGFRSLMVSTTQPHL